jgi:PAS domain S-box-containing protein
MIERFPRSRVFGYALAVGSTLLALLLTEWLPLDRTPFPLFFAAILLSSWKGGVGPGLLSTVLGGSAILYMLRFATVAEPLDMHDFLRFSVFAAVGIFAVFVAVTMRRAMANVRRQSEYLSVTLASIGDAVLATDPLGRITLLNRVAEELTGWTQTEAIGQPIDTVFHIVNESSGRPVVNPVRIVLAEGRIVGLANHTLLIAKDGTRRPIDDSAAPVRTRDGELLGVVLVFRDVSERRQQELTLRESEERHRLITELTSDYTSTARLTPDGAFVPETITEGFCRISGYTLEDLNALGGWQHVLFPEDVPQIEKSIQRIVAGQQDSAEIRLRTRSGETRWVRYLGRLAQATEGDPAKRIISAGQDITERKRQEELQIEQVRLSAFGRDVGLSLAQDHDVSVMLRHCSEAMVKHLDAAFARVWVLNESENVLELQASAGMYTHIDGPHCRVPVGQYKIGMIAQERRPHLTNSVVGDGRVHDQQWAEREKMTAFAGYPLIVEERLVGVMAMFARHPLSDSALDAMASVANAIAVGIDRKRAESQRIEQQEWLRVTLESIGDAVIATDARGHVVFLNSVAETLTGWRQLEAAGLPLDEVFHIVDENTGRKVNNAVAKVLQEGKTVGLANHTILISRSGERRPIDDSAAPIRRENGEILGAVLVFRDIWERRAAEIALQQSESRKSAIVETALDCIITIDEQGRIVEFNPAAEQTFGYRRDEVLGQPMAELIVPPDLRPAHYAGLSQFLVSGQGRVLGKRIELPALRADGSRFPAELAIAPISVGSTSFFTAYLRDIGERKRSEQRRSARLAVSQILAHALSVNESLPRLLQAVCEALEWDAGIAWMVDHAADALRRVDSWHHPQVSIQDLEAATRDITFARSVGMPGRIWSTGRPEWIADVTRDDGYMRSFAAERSGLRGAVGCPIVFGQDVLGVIEFFSREMREPDADLLELLTTLGAQIGQFIERRKTEQRLHDETRIIETLYRIGNRLAGELDLQRLVQMVTDESTALCAAEFGAFFYNTVDRNGESYRLYTLSGASSESFAEFPLPRNTEVFAPTFRGEGVVRLDDVTQDPRFGKNLPYQGMPPGHLPVRSYLAVPVISRSGDVIGGLFFGHSNAAVFTPRDERIIVGIAAQAAVAMDNARLYQQVQESDQRFRQLAENIEDVFWMSDPNEPSMLYISPAYERIWGRSCQSLYQQPLSFLEAVHSEDRELVKDALQRQLAGETTVEEYRIVRPDGTVRWIWDRGFPLVDKLGNVHAVAGVAEDKTEAKRHEVLLTVQKRVLEKIVQGAPLADVLETLCELVEGQINENPLASILLLDDDGRHLRPVAGRRVPSGWTRLLDPLQIGPDARAFAAAAFRGESLITGNIATDPAWTELREAAESNQLRACWSTPILSSQHKLLGTFTVYYDTPSRPGEHDLRLVDLLTRTAGIAIERKQAEEALRDSDRRKDEFLATLAHELRNPLAPIRNGLQVMQLAADDPEITEQARKMMERQVLQMVRLVDDLLDVSRISRGKIELRKERVLLSDVIQSAVETSWPLIEDGGHCFSLHVPQDPVWLNADPTRMAQVIANLLNNAAKYTPNGGNIRLSAEQTADQLQIRVRDNGIGIPAEMRHRIFEMFAQVSDTNNRGFGGLGIGLTLVKRLVEMHNGDVEVHSAGADQGSEFIVRLPAVRQRDGDTGTRPATSEVALATAGHRILVADDNTDAAYTLSMLLRLLGHQVLIVHDGETALQAAATEAFDVVFLDIGMPKLNGYEVARRWRQLPQGQQATLIALTGWGQEEDRQRTQQAGFDHHLTKPADLHTVQNLLGGRGHAHSESA